MHKRRKILLISNSAKISGAERSLLDVIAVLKQAHDITIVLPEMNDLYHLLNGHVEIKVVKMVRVALKRNILNLVRQAWQLMKGARLLARIVKEGKFDLIYANTIQAHIYGLLIKLLTGKRIIWHVRDNIRSRRQVRALAANTDLILAISRHIMRQFPAQRRVHLVYNGLDMTAWEQISASGLPGIREIVNIGSEKLLIAHVGQLVPWKRHELFIEVASAIRRKQPNVHFLLIGQDHFDQHAGYVRFLREKVITGGLASCFSMLPYQPSFQYYLRDIDILVHLARDEPFGRVVMEAMASRIAIVAFANGGPAELIINGENGFLIPPDDLEQVAEKIQLLIEDPEMRSAFGANGRSHVEQHFPIENLTAILDLIAQIDV